ncbi:MAG: hypothetical protein V1494_04920 [Candidatus Diapherotrites archaeon]
MMQPRYDIRTSNEVFSLFRAVYFIPKFKKSHEIDADDFDLLSYLNYSISAVGLQELCIYLIKHKSTLGHQLNTLREPPTDFFRGAIITEKTKGKKKFITLSPGALEKLSGTKNTELIEGALGTAENFKEYFTLLDKLKDNKKTRNAIARLANSRNYFNIAYAGSRWFLLKRLKSKK